MISIISANWNSYDFAKVLIETVQMFTKNIYEIIIVDNSLQKEELAYPNVVVLPQTTNIGHGAALNLGSKEAQYEYVMFVDIDGHFIKRDWDEYFLDLIENFDIIAGRGVPEKPIRPACMFLKRKFAVQYDWRDTPGYKGHRITPDGYDVAIQAYHQIIKDGLRLKLIESKPSKYQTLNGEDWCIDQVPLFYHHWHGSHLSERQVDFPDRSLQEDKNHLFSQLYWRYI